MGTGEPMSEAQLREIRTRVAVATPGPWLADGWEVFNANHRDLVVEQTVEANDATFIAHAREDIPTLLAYVDVLQSKNARLRYIVEHLGNLDLEHASLADMHRLMAQARAEVEEKDVS